MEITVERGLGYSSIESRKRAKQEVGNIAVDAIFTPVKMINYTVEDMRVGDKTNYNRLRLDIETDGTIAPADAMAYAANLLIDQFKIAAAPAVKPGKKEEAGKEIMAKKEEKEEAEETAAAKTRVEDLKLSSRTQKVLTGGHIKTVAGILQMSENELLELGGLGEKAIKEIKKALGKLGLTLKQE
jgi:DNA-directed RNA polymerase subunit alpha